MEESYLSVEPQVGATYGPEPGEPLTYAVYRYSPYESWSVNAGQLKRSFIAGGYETEAAALAEYPAAQTGGGYVEPTRIPASAPAWFDPSLAGESWDGD